MLSYGEHIREYPSRWFCPHGSALSHTSTNDFETDSPPASTSPVCNTMPCCRSSRQILSCSQLVRVLVSPTNPPGATSSCQKAMFQCGLLQQLCTILMATGIPADILTEVNEGKTEATLGVGNPRN